MSNTNLIYSVGVNSSFSMINEHLVPFGLMPTVENIRKTAIENYKSDLNNHNCASRKGTCDDIDCEFFINRTTCLENCSPYCTNKRLVNMEVLVSIPKNYGEIGNGLRATRDIQPGEFICHYFGKLSTATDFKAIANPGSPREKYGVPYDEDGTLVIDGLFQGNLGVFIKQDCDGNCQLQRWYDRDGYPNAIIVAMKLIRKGEQLMCIDGPEYKAFGVLNCHSKSSKFQMNDRKTEDTKGNWANEQHVSTKMERKTCEPIVVVVNRSDGVGTIDSYACGLCREISREYKSVYAVNRHHKVSHSFEGKVKMCQICDKTFGRADVLKVHIQSHYPTRERVLCEQCDKSFVSKQGMLEHVFLKHEGGAYICELKTKSGQVCGKRFLSRYSHKKHQKDHNHNAEC